MTITLINTFVVPAAVEAEFVATWRSTIDHFRTAPGFIETRLHRNTGLQDTTYGYVNVARWESVAAYRAVFEDFVPAGQRIPGVVAHPGLFEVVAEVTAPAADPS
jgi:heme-degrading monooxygenase HmoA